MGPAGSEGLAPTPHVPMLSPSSRDGVHRDGCACQGPGDVDARPWQQQQQQQQQQTCTVHEAGCTQKACLAACEKEKKGELRIATQPVASPPPARHGLGA
ncbi:hypothetical protein ColTof4_02702 [Colletotrichum tofieldiae]|nr:hypothetical protein ColTof3_09005 [Colletotrichum tofieldiae]GKT70279.1 hypothetical protein ColTof4_02702 [Colletotrichum tofieldiae]GKT93335.1 hypothetical protein Ct61P_11185 [Colletotrichum tofieldiae]